MISKARALVFAAVCGACLSSVIPAADATPITPASPVAPAAPTATTEGINESTASAGAKYFFGKDPLAAVNAAATAYANANGRCISPRGLAGLMLAPTYGETGAGTSAAPSPMTLSRYDTDIGLHSLSDRSRYPQAFWHPGIGAWQFDSAGGWGKTAAERIDVAHIASLAARVMGDAYCRSKDSSPDELTARRKAWGPWVACRSDRCNPVFDSLIANGVIPQQSVTNQGGMTAVTCRIPGSSTNRSCQRVDPALAQGATGFRSAGFGPAPISKPFTVVSDGTNEWRMWAATDTGYGVDIAAAKPLGVNARSRLVGSCERVSPIKWYVNGVLTDSVDRSGCTSEPPAGFAKSSFAVNSTYQTLVGDFDGDALDDVLWFAPGGNPDSFWRSPLASIRSTPLTINGNYEPIIGDFDGDRRDDIFWYTPGPGSEYDWRGRASSGLPFDDRGISVYQVNADYETAVGDFNGDDVDDIVWFSPASPMLHLWLGSSGGFTTFQLPLGQFPVTDVGDFDGDGRDDLLSYRAGSAVDAVLWSTGTGFTPQTMAVNRSYRPYVGDFDNNTADDIYWYALDGGSDAMWFSPVGRATPGSDSTSAADFQLGNGLTGVVLDTPTGDELIWTDFGPGTDARWTFNGRTRIRTTDVSIDRAYRLVPGRWASASEGLLLYAPGGTIDQLWVR